MAGRNWDVHLKAGVYSGYTGSTDYAGKMGTESNQHYHQYLWFDNVTLTSGITIDSVFVWVRGYSSDGSNCTLTVWCEDTADAASYPNTTSDISSRTKTTASVVYSPASWSTTGDNKLGGNLAAIVQEVVDRGDWASGNAMAFFFENTHSLGTTSLIFNRTYDYFADGGGTPAPRIVYYYHTASAGTDSRRRRVIQFGHADRQFPVFGQWEFEP